MTQPLSWSTWCDRLRAACPGGELPPTRQIHALIDFWANDVSPEAVAKTFAEDGEIVKVCTCGKSYTREQWGRLLYCGAIVDDVEALELRNCSACDSTLSVVVAGRNEMSLMFREQAAIAMAASCAAMGRELRRVPLDFDWPIDMIWRGFLNPYHSQECKPCGGSGHNPETKKISDDFYDFANTGRRWSDAVTLDEVQALVDGGRLCEWVGGEERWRTRTVVDEAFVEKVNAANRRGGGGLGHDLNHDGINRWILIEARAKRLGVYGNCPTCKGEGCVWASDEIKRLHEAWEDVPPPKGEGFQLWTTTNEGAPISPVFPSLDALATWCETNATTFPETNPANDAADGEVEP